MGIPDTYYQELYIGELNNGVTYKIAQSGRMRYSLLVKWGKTSDKMAGYGFYCGKKQMLKEVQSILKDYREPMKPPKAVSTSMTSYEDLTYKEPEKPKDSFLMLAEYQMEQIKKRLEGMK